MDDRDREATPSTSNPSTTSVRGAAPATVAACHPDLVCPVCSARGKTVRMQPVKAHYQCPDCRYFDSCCM
jgi:transposase-like protein